MEKSWNETGISRSDRELMPPYSRIYINVLVNYFALKFFHIVQLLNKTKSTYSASPNLSGEFKKENVHSFWKQRQNSIQSYEEIISEKMGNLKSKKFAVSLSSVICFNFLVTAAVDAISTAWKPEEEKCFLFQFNFNEWPSLQTGQKFRNEKWGYKAR